MVVGKKMVLLLLFGMMQCMAFAQQKNFILRTMDWGYKLVQGDSTNPKKKYFFVIPIVSYKPETRWQAGVSLAHFFKASQDSITRTSVVRVNTIFTQNKQSSVRPFFDVFFKENKYNLRGFYQYTDFVEYYWGIGNRVTDQTKESYSFTQHKVAIKATKLIGHNVYAGFQYNLERLTNLRFVQENGLSNAEVIGNKGYFESGFGPVLSYDSRNHIYFPTKGSFIDASISLYRPGIGSEHNFTNLTLDARKYVGLWGENVLAIQGLLQYNTAQTPFRMMGTLGSESYFRGYYFGRYRDLQAATFQAELRKHVWGPLSLTLFAGAGNVAPTLNQLNRYVKPMYGIGIRMKAIPREKVNMRLDYAWGEKGISALYITLNEAF